MKKTIIFVVIVVAVAVAIYALFGGGNSSVPNSTASSSPTASISPSVSPVPTLSPSPTASGTKTPTPTAVSTIKTFTIVGRPFSFTPSEITVNKGDTVKIIFQNVSGNHDWKLDEFNAHTDIIGGGQEQTIQFVADKTGTFEYYCSVGTHRLMGMKGNLIVK